MDSNIIPDFPLVSIIMPAFNAEKYISKSIESVLAQCYSNWELIIIDDGSDDNTAFLVNKFCIQDNRIKYNYQLNKKLGSARNSGLKLVTGKYVAFLDSDDLWLPNKLKCQIKAFENKNIDIVYTSGYKLHADKDLFDYPSVFGIFNSLEMYDILFNENVIPILSVLIKTEFVREVGFQEINNFGCEDWDYWIRCALNGGTFYGINEKHFIYRVHDNGMSRNFALMRISEINVLRKNYNNTYYKNKLLSKIKNKLFEHFILLINHDRKYVINIIDELIKIKFSISYFIVMLILKLRINIFNNYFQHLFYLSKKY